MDTNRTGVALAITLVILFIICALAQWIAPHAQLSHAYVVLFTAAPIGTARAWIEGIIGSVVFGWIGGAVFASVYNALSVQRRNER